MAKHNWRDEYEHERTWKKADPTLQPTPAPMGDPSLESALRFYLESRGLDYTVARKSGGWYAAYYRGPRCIIPCVRSDGGMWWQGRLIDTLRNSREKIMFDPKRWDGAHGYRGDAVCYIPADPSKPTVIVEGPMDALASAGCGFPAIAILGVTPPKIVFDQVARLVDRSYLKGQAIIIPDNDRLGCWVDTQLELGKRGIYARIQQITSGAKDLAELNEQDRMEFLNA